MMEKDYKNKKIKEILERYFEDEMNKSNEVVVNYCDRRVVFYNKNLFGNGQGGYIKKYILHKKPKLMVMLGLKKNPCNHYKNIVYKIREIGLGVIDAEITLEKRENFFYRKYIIVTKNGGKTLSSLEKKFKDNKDIYIKFFNFFIKLCQNKIYPTDFNLGGFLINEKNEINLIDLDSYKIDKKLNKKLIEKLIKGLEGNYKVGIHEEKFIEFFKEQVKRVKKELNWE
ncbi:hypothetical protein [Fusobacterium sp. PH5-7]|uniref:hypothetical protein n=1 Tax=Fusobacterium sp. PH5-7 TaxID=2940528 RepID=UPI0024746B8D|nr:hypothetical protein [Fusobacterium sp. PH5-7]